MNDDRRAKAAAPRSAVRVLVSGMGGELGSRVASLLERQPWVESLMGIDADPPRRRLRRAEFHRIGPGHHDQIVSTITAFNPHVVAHLAVWEPDARANTATAKRLTAGAATSILGAAAECTALESIVVRSGIEIYGRRRGSLTRPDERAPIDPTSVYGEMVAGIEQVADAIGARVGIKIGSLRLATVIGPHVPSALGRLLRMPVVPMSAMSDPPFAVIHQNDAARAFVNAVRARLDQPVNIVAPGAITSLQAARRGRRIPLPLFGPDWAAARAVSYLMGAPIPDHVLEMLSRGRLADGALATNLLNFVPKHSTSDVIEQLYGWPSVIHLPATRQVA